MNTRNPLAAALLLIASTASAQLLTGPTGSGFSMTSGNSSFGAPAPVDDMVFKCGTVPYVACTTAQMNLREGIKASGKCPQPASAACVDYLMKQSGSANPVETIAAYNPPDGTRWASPDCTHIPCRLADGPTAPTSAGQSYENEPGFIGPPSPPKSNLPPAFDAKDFQKELADARSESQNTIVDLGDNRYGVVLDDGTVSVCGNGLCNTPRPASEFPKLAEQIQAATSLNSGKGSLNNDNPNGFTAKSDKGKVASSGDNGAKTESSPSPDTSASDEAKGMGRQAAADSAAVSGTSGSSWGAGTSVAASASSAGGEPGTEVIKTKGASLGSIEITYSRLQRTEADIRSAAGSFNDGRMTGFAAPNAPTPGTAGDPPVDERYLGKIQAAANE